MGLCIHSSNFDAIYKLILSSFSVLDTHVCDQHDHMADCSQTEDFSADGI